MILRLKREVRQLFQNKIRLILTAVFFVLCAVLTWFDADGMSLVSRLFAFPSLTLPLWILFFVWISSFLLISVLSVPCTDEKGICGLVELLFAFVFLLFWCPLLFSAASGVLSGISALLSLIFTALSVLSLRKRSLLGMTAGILLGLNVGYFSVISLGFAFMN